MTPPQQVEYQFLAQKEIKSTDSKMKDFIGPETDEFSFNACIRQVLGIPILRWENYYLRDIDLWKLIANEFERHDRTALPWSRTKNTRQVTETLSLLQCIFLPTIIALSSLLEHFFLVQCFVSFIYMMYYIVAVHDIVLLNRLFAEGKVAEPPPWASSAKVIITRCCHNHESPCFAKLWPLLARQSLVDNGVWSRRRAGGKACGAR